MEMMPLKLNGAMLTTDGDHITKEHTRVKVIKACGYKPIRVMFYYPLRASHKDSRNAKNTLRRS